MLPTLGKIISDPAVRALDPTRQHFLKAHRLSAKINPFALEIDVVTVQGLPNLKAVPAFAMLMHDHDTGLHLGKDILVVPSSGNTAYVVAQLAPAFGFKRTIIAVTPDLPAFKRSVIGALPQVEIIEFAQDSVDEAARLTQRLGARALLLDQYGHEANRAAHARYTAPELVRALDGAPDLIITALGSAGTAMGLAQYFRERHPDTVILGAQPHLGQKAPGTRDSLGIRVVPFAWRAILDDVVLGSEFGARTRMSQLSVEVDPCPGPSAGLSFDCLLRYLEGLPQTARAALRGKRAAVLCHDSALLYPEFAAGRAAGPSNAPVRLVHPA